MTIRISRSAGSGTSISRRITAATVADSLKTGTMIEIRGGTRGASIASRGARHRFFLGGAFATGAGRYSISTLLIVATGRPAEVN